MKTRHVAALGRAVAACALAPLAAADWKTPRTPWGDPDLAGHLDERGRAERAVRAGTRSTATRQWLTDAEFAQRLKQTDAATRHRQRRVLRSRAPTSPTRARSARPRRRRRTGSSAAKRRAARRSSSIRRTAAIPPMTAGGAAAPGARRAPAAAATAPSTAPSEMSLWVRCITRGLPSVTFPTVYNANTRIVQGPGYVAITYEMIHDTRVIPPVRRGTFRAGHPAVPRRLARPLGRRTRSWSM